MESKAISSTSSSSALAVRTSASDPETLAAIATLR
jgi:hypothetical protein